ncbi:MAG: thiolase domain-containing protein [Anaerolineales bacterium]|nr:thiolase domain-containing protein [Anaerolineales bacterium]
MKNNVSIIGIGQTAVGEHWDVSLRHLAWQAIEAALDDAAANGIDAINEIEAIYVGNMLGGVSSQQDHLGALVADYAGLRGVEAVTVEAAEASGAAAVRQAVMAVLSGQVKVAMAIGVEKTTDETGSESLRSQSSSLDADFEIIHGATPAAMAGLMMQRYMHEHKVELANFAGFSVNAHANGANNPKAMFRNRLKAEKFPAAPLVADPVNLFDAAPVGDGAAAVIITSTEYAAEAQARNVVNIIGSAMATDAFSLHDRQDPLWLEAVAKSTERALAQAGIGREEVDLIELHDSFTIMSTLALEAMGFAEQGNGWQLAQENKIMKDGTLPISTFGGLKARGNPIGATGVYQIAEVAQQLRGQAGDNQIAEAQIGLAQNIAGTGGTVVTHVLQTA